MCSRPFVRTHSRNSSSVPRRRRHRRGRYNSIGAVLVRSRSPETSIPTRPNLDRIPGSIDSMSEAIDGIHQAAVNDTPGAMDSIHGAMDFLINGAMDSIHGAMELIYEPTDVIPA